MPPKPTTRAMTRAEMMANIRGRDTKPELMVRRYLHGRGLRYRLNDKRVIGKPDLVFPRYGTVVFVHGCFWHRHDGCRLAYNPKSRVEFWNEKFAKNTVRDSTVREQLIQLGFNVAIIWECLLRSKSQREAGLDSLYQWIIATKAGTAQFLELGLDQPGE